MERIIGTQSLKVATANGIDYLKVAIIDTDLIGRKKHRFPNLVCMKLSGHYKETGSEVELKTDYENLNTYDKVFVSKVFTDTPIEDNVLRLPNVKYGGTGFFYDKAPKLDCQIEHHMPDYHLYDEWVNRQLENGGRRLDFKYYLDYSIGFTTRGCFRQCPFCVNKNYTKVELHSALDEFVDESRPKICLLDDNVLGSPKWKNILTQLQDTKKPFQFNQGMDERILTDKKCEMLFKSKYDGDYIFAFDNVEDYELIEKKLNLIKKYTNKIPKFYTFCGFDREDKWNEDFWKQDILDIFKRIELLMKYHSLPYIMRFDRYVESPYRGVYITIARWCNQPSFFKKKSLREFGFANGRNSACNKYIYEYLRDVPQAKKYIDMKWK